MDLHRGGGFVLALAVPSLGWIGRYLFTHHRTTTVLDVTYRQRGLRVLWVAVLFRIELWFFKVGECFSRLLTSQVYGFKKRGSTINEVFFILPWQ